MDNQYKRLAAVVLTMLIIGFSWQYYHFWRQTSLAVENLQDKICFDVSFENKEHVGVKAWYCPHRGKWYLFLPSMASSVKAIESEELKIGFNPIDVHTIKDSILVPLSVDNGYSVLSDSITVFKSENIPSLFITTKSESMDFIHSKKGNKETGVLTMYGPDSLDNISNLAVEFSGRGNTSWFSDKKGFLIKAVAPVDLMGTVPATDWILVANAHTNLLSNTIAFELEKLIGCENSVTSKHVDLYLNGVYHGNYMLCERIQVGRQNMQLANLDSLNMQLNPSLIINESNKYHSKDKSRKGYHLELIPQDITGGYLLERDVPEYWEVERVGFITETGDHYVVHSPKYGSKEQVQYIQAFLNDAMYSLVDSTGVNERTGKRYNEYFDETSFVKKYLIDEFLAYRDAGRSSAYYYKNSDINDALLHAGPGWDYEGAFLNDYNYITLSHTSGYSTNLYVMLNSQKDFKAATSDYYRTRMIPAIDSILQTRLPYFKDKIMASAKMDELRWNRTSFPHSCDTIQVWMKKRQEILTDYFSTERCMIELSLPEIDKTCYMFKSIGDTLSYNEVFGLFGNFQPSVKEFCIASTDSAITFPYIVRSDAELSQAFHPAKMGAFARIINIMRQSAVEVCFVIVFIIMCVWYLVERR